MSNEIETLNPTELSVWTNDARNFIDVATYLCASEFVPQNYKGKPEAIVSAVMFGSEIGMKPMTCLQNIAVIKGKPTLSSHGMRALVLGAGHDVWFEEQSSTKVVACGQRKGSEHVTRVVWTIDRAEALGVQNLGRMPENMLIARATSEICRLVAPDALAGITYSAEEMETVAEAVTAPRKKRTLKRSKHVEPQTDNQVEAEEVKPEEAVIDSVDIQTGEIVGDNSHE